MDNLDKKIQSILSNNLDISEEYSNMINSTLKHLPNKNKKSFTFKKIKWSLIATCCFAFSISGIVFSKNISNFVQNFFNYNKGIDTAINHGYLEEPAPNYIESNGTTVNLENVLMDDFTLNFSLSINTNNEIDISKISRIRIPDMIITDEENRILFCDNREVFETYCQNNNLDYEYTEFTENYINSSSNWYIKEKSSENNTATLVYNLSGDNFPKSKKLIISFNQINMSYNEISENEENILTGNWNIVQELPEMFYNRKAILYNIKNCNYSDLNITEAYLTNTGMRFEFTANFKKWFDEDASQETKDEAYENFRVWRMKELENDRKLIYDEYLINEKGEKFYPLESSTEDAFTQYQVTGDFLHIQTFNLTQFDDNSNNLTLHFIINLPYEKREVTIELEKKQ